MSSDAELILRYKDGEDDEFEELVRRYLNIVYNYANRYVNNSTDAIAPNQVWGNRWQYHCAVNTSKAISIKR